MTFLLDENFPRAARGLLESAGHDVRDVRGSPIEGGSDVEVFDLARRLRATLLTTDRDFFHTVPHLYANHSGVVVIALRQPNRRNILARLEWFLRKFAQSDLQDSVYELRDRTYVVYSSSTG